MRLCWKGWIAALLLAAPVVSLAASCTTQSELQPQDRDALAAAGQRLSVAVLQQDYSTLQGALFQGVAQDWNGIRGAIEDGVPPGKYAVILSDAAGAPLGGEMGIILVWDPTGAVPGWKLGGLSLRQGIIDGHDGVWYWTRARGQAATGAPWSAYYSYDMARYLLLPVDFISSPNMDKLMHEQSEIKGSPTNSFPYSVTDGPRTWKIDSIRVD